MSVPAPVKQAVDDFDRRVEGMLTRLNRMPGAPRLLYAASEAGNFSTLWHSLAWAPVLLAPTPVRVRRAVVASIALGVESALVNGPVKSAFRRDRPVRAAGVPPPYRLRTPRTTSFPSGHATAAMVAATMLGRDRHLVTRTVIRTMGLTVATSRVYVRAHHASDVIGGLVIGAALGRLFRRLLP
jgi:membrane-associated phospholipid phosphatase